MNDSALEAAIAPLAAAHPGCSGIHPLPGGLDAFAARMLLAGAAERTLDVQYYIWDGDKTGTLLFNALRAAADRGVRVRLLLDDHNAIGLDETLAELDTHPMLEVRLFNPLRIRRPRWINYLIDFTRVNRRMHNKSITADAAATIVGGRNVADKYFDASDEIVFADLDVLAVGPVARDVAADFERYWNSVSACPARRLCDDPAKARGRARRRPQMSFRLDAIVGESASSVDLVSAYFGPTARGVRALTQLARRGVAIRILTNSLAATDVAAVHAGYAKR